MLNVAVNTIMIAKPEKGKQVENLIINMAQSGRIQARVSEAELINMLEQINSSTTKTTTVKVSNEPKKTRKR